MSDQELPRFDQLRAGDQARVTRRFEASDLQEWCRLAGYQGDWPKVPEPLIAALFSYLLGEELPGHGTNYLKQNMRFHAAGRPGEALTATVTVSRLRRDKALVYLDTRCTGEGDRLICDGDALVLFQC
ncbi:hypothetical protein [Alloalcanivorax marinus]|uniref:hypothetical protein n=1 Tax=Alloalcanivorax marinus TaxID=1177169 RepID=UPI00193243F0|nr:hypothetical protein [Alloalcanivorax marinus]MBL7249207.1 hypothetical protein [Alloalcanivorax marinus]